MDDLYWEAQWCISEIYCINNRTDEEDLALDVLLQMRPSVKHSFELR